MTEGFLKISMSELCEAEHIDQQVVVEVVEYGIAAPVEGNSANEWIFDTTSVHWLKRAIRLYVDLEIDWISIAMVIELLKQKERLISENQQLQGQLQRFVQH